MSGGDRISVATPRILVVGSINIDIVALTVAVWALVIVVMIIGFVIIGIGNSAAGDKGATAGLRSQNVVHPAAGLK